MNRILRSALLLSLIAAVSLPTALAQSEGDWLAGTWEGTMIVAGTPLGIVYHLESSDGDAFSGTMDVPAQYLSGLPLSNISVGNEVSWSFPVPGGGRYSGRRTSDGAAIDGTFHQAGQSFSLRLEKKIRPSAEDFIRRYMAAVSARDEDAIRTMIDGDRFLWIEDGVVRYTSVDDILGGLASLGPDTRFETTVSEGVEQALGESGAVYHTAFETTIESETGEFSFSGRMSLFLELAGDAYVLVGGHTSGSSR